MKLSTRIVWVLVGIWLSTGAGAESHTHNDNVRLAESGSVAFTDGAVFPASADLSSQFPPFEYLQSGGTCHIHAATALYSAACKRTTGKSLNIHDGYLFLLFLYDELKRGRNPSRVALALNHTTELSGLDGSFVDYIMGTMRRMAKGSVIIDEGGVGVSQELSKVGDILSSEIKRFVRAGYSTAQAEKKAGDSLYAALKIAIPRLPYVKRVGKDFVLQPQTEELRDCIRRREFIPNEEPYSQRRAVELLSQGIPFSCAGSYDLDAKVVKSGVNHIAVVTGYHYNLEENRMQFAVRNAHGAPSPHTWGWDIKGCERIFYYNY